MSKDTPEHANQHFDAACLAHYLDSIGNDLEAAPRDADETLEQYAERLLSALQDLRYYLVEELDEIERDLEGVIDYVNHLGEVDAP